MSFLIFICIYGMQDFKCHLMIYMYFLVCRYGVVAIVYICCVDFWFSIVLFYTFHIVRFLFGIW
ncbi:unknown [Prevotella sp. CAG:1185]|nr:unknown [Prevotella sp. CAG:1185]